jgi:hypothetical protein
VPVFMQQSRWELAVRPGVYQVIESYCGRRAS